MIFIGQNNCGKSNILTALLCFFNQYKHSEFDLHSNEHNSIIEMEFESLDSFDQIQFKKYLTANNKIKVRKTATSEGGYEYHGFIEQANENWLKEENFSEYNSREKIENTPLNEFIPESGRITKDIYNKAIFDYIEANKDSLEFSYVLESTPFLGLKTVASGIWGDIFFIPAVKNASDELSNKGIFFSQLYSRVINKISERNEKYSNAKNQLEELSSLLNKTKSDGTINNDRPIELNNLEAKINEELTSWDTTIDVEISPPDINDIFKVGAKVWLNDGTKTDVDRKGHGLQRSLIFCLLKAYAGILKEERESINNEEIEQPTRRSSNSSYFIFEEPELFLHPQAQRELFDALLNMSRINNQILLCTHSSSFLDLDLYKSICIVKKERETGTKILQCTDNIFTDDQKQKFNLIYWLNPERNELFFAKKVILVEGPSDKTVIPYLSKKLGLFKFDYTFIECGGKTNIHLYMKILNKLKQEYIAIYDKDHQSYKDRDAKNSADIHSRIIESAIDTTLGKSIIFENDIEEEIGITERNDKNKPHKALKMVTNETYVIPENLEKKIRLIYV